MCKDSGQALRGLLIALLIRGVFVLPALGAEIPAFKVRVRETQGLDRTSEIVRVPLKQEQAGGMKAGTLRVTDAGGKGVPSQILRIGDAPVLCFAAEVPAHGERIYSVQPGEPARPEFPLFVVGLPSRQMETVVRNKFYAANLMAGSAALNYLIVAGDPRWILYNELQYVRCEEQIGPIHWTPDVLSLLRRPKYLKPRPKGFWPKTFQWRPAPGLREDRGPLLYRIRRRGPMYVFPEVDAEVVYLFSAVEPQIIVESTITMVKDLQVRYLRNGEWVFKGSTFTFAVCRDKAGKIHRFPITYKSRSGTKANTPPLQPEDPWLAFYSPKTGLGFAIVRLEIRNTGPAGKEPILDHYRMSLVNYGPRSILEVCRVLVGRPGGGRDPNCAVTVTAGNTYYMREAVFTFDAREQDAVELLDRRARRLRHPLEVTLVD